MYLAVLAGREEFIGSKAPVDVDKVKESHLQVQTSLLTRTHKKSVELFLIWFAAPINSGYSPSLVNSSRSCQ